MVNYSLPEDYIYSNEIIAYLKSKTPKTVEPNDLSLYPLTKTSPELVKMFRKHLICDYRLWDNSDHNSSEIHELFRHLALSQNMSALTDLCRYFFGRVKSIRPYDTKIGGSQLGYYTTARHTSDIKADLNRDIFCEISMEHIGRTSLPMRYRVSATNLETYTTAMLAGYVTAFDAKTMVNFEGIFNYYLPTHSEDLGLYCSIDFILLQNLTTANPFVSMYSGDNSVNFDTYLFTGMPEQQIKLADEMNSNKAVIRELCEIYHNIGPIYNS